MWTPEHRRAAERSGLRYPSDLSDAEWALVAPLIPPSKRGGRPRSVNVREVLNAIFYVLWTGCQWNAHSGEGGQAFHLKADSDSGRSRTAFR
jgi:transposase